MDKPSWINLSGYVNVECENYVILRKAIQGSFVSTIFLQDLLQRAFARKITLKAYLNGVM